MTKHEQDKLDMMLHIMTEHRSESKANHELLQKSLTTHGEDISMLKERSNTTKSHVKYLYGLVLTALGLGGASF